MKNLLGRTLPDKMTERKKIFLRLRQLRLIEYRSEEAFENGEGWIKIHPMIVTFVSNNAVQALEPVINIEDAEPDTTEPAVESDRMDLAEGEV